MRAAGCITDRLTTVNLLSGEVLAIKSRIPFATQRAFTVRILKKDIERETGITTQQQILHVIEREEPLEDYEVLVGHEVFMTVDRTGGGFAMKRKQRGNSPVSFPSRSLKFKATVPAPNSRSTKRRIRQNTNTEKCFKKPKAAEEKDTANSLLELLESFEFNISQESEDVEHAHECKDGKSSIDSVVKRRKVLVQKGVVGGKR
jgi:hypothetical protein